MARNDSVEIWAGLECTINRVGDEYFDQCELNGHYRRPEDMELFCDLGITALRYPVLWERMDGAGNGCCEWTMSDARLAVLRRRCVRPIVGLIHHGSGPRNTHLLEPSFPKRFAAYAGAVAKRYAWIDAYTPVNEPLTTARFSALYGHWYPHAADNRSFVQALLNQCRAVVLAMQAIRRVNSSAELVQTDDLGKVYSSGRLKYQADFENERRWITWDLLCGRVDRNHALWSYLIWAGADEREILWFADNPCPPDVIGVNYYITSERFLDHRVERYPVQSHGGNGQDRYADVEAVRVLADGIAGVGSLLNEAWQRYHLPLAVTEVHLGCTPDEQSRWLFEVWSEACQGRRRDVDVRAIAAWSLLGSYDWHCMLTRRENHYEPGVFDVRSERPCPTPVAALLRMLARGGISHEFLPESPGWWRRDERLLYPPLDRHGRDCLQADLMAAAS